MKKLLAIAIVFMIFIVAFIRLQGCASIPDITGVPTCGKGNGVSCLKCHDFRVDVVPWYDSIGNTGHVEVILPEGININWNYITNSYVVNPKSDGRDWVCRHVYAVYEKGIWTVQILYNRWSDSNQPPAPPLCIAQIVSRNPSDATGTVPADKLFWIYRRGMPEQVTENEIDLFILGLSGDRI